MKSLPAGLPAANSAKWHSRRWWDGLGYLRVRSLANPQWQRDTPWLTRLLLLQRIDASDAERPLYDAAVVATRRYPRTASGAVDVEQSWDEVLTAIDELLQSRQARHLSDVRDAQREQAQRGGHTTEGTPTNRGRSGS